MVAIAVVTLFIAILAGMGISVFAFGTGGKRSKVFEDIYFSVEDVNGMGIIYTKGGDYSTILKMNSRIFSLLCCNCWEKGMPCINRMSSYESSLI